MTNPLLLGFLLIVCVQATITGHGLRYLQDSSWYQPAYQDISATLLEQRVDTTNAILLVSFPEPYFLHFNQDTQSIADHRPYIQIPDAVNDQRLLIVEDRGMRDVFPTFTKFLHNHASETIVAEYVVMQRYHYEDRSEEPDGPVRVYEMTVGELKEKIQNETQYAYSP